MIDLLLAAVSVIAMGIAIFSGMMVGVWLFGLWEDRDWCKRGYTSHCLSNRFKRQRTNGAHHR